MKVVKKGRILEYINNYKHAEWSSPSSSVMVEPSTEPVGPKQDLPGSRIGIFSLMFTPDVISHMVRERNRYAAQCLEGTDKEWRTNSEEILAYLSFVVLMRIVRKPEETTGQSLLFFHYSPIA